MDAVGHESQIWLYKMDDTEKEMYAEFLKFSSLLTELFKTGTFLGLEAIEEETRSIHRTASQKEPIRFHWPTFVICKGFHLVFAQLQAGPACKPSKKTATAVHRVAPGHARRPASPTGAWPGLYPMKSKLTEQAAVV